MINKEEFKKKTSMEVRNEIVKEKNENSVGEAINELSRNIKKLDGNLDNSSSDNKKDNNSNIIDVLTIISKTLDDLNKNTKKQEDPEIVKQRKEEREEKSLTQQEKIIKLLEKQTNGVSSKKEKKKEEEKGLDVTTILAGLLGVNGLKGFGASLGKILGGIGGILGLGGTKGIGAFIKKIPKMIGRALLLTLGPIGAVVLSAVAAYDFADGFNNTMKFTGKEQNSLREKLQGGFASALSGITGGFIEAESLYKMMDFVFVGISNMWAKSVEDIKKYSQEDGNLGKLFGSLIKNISMGFISDETVNEMERKYLAVYDYLEIMADDITIKTREWFKEYITDPIDAFFAPITEFISKTFDYFKVKVEGIKNFLGIKTEPKPEISNKAVVEQTPDYPNVDQQGYPVSPPKVDKRISNATKIINNTLSGKPIYEDIKPMNDEIDYDLNSVPPIDLDKHKGKISSEYGMRKDPLTKKDKMHEGMDIATKQGVPVKSIKKGKVLFSGSLTGYGETVKIKHEDGSESRYAHLHERKVKTGETVSLGQTIGSVGSSGRSTGNHLHFEVRDKNGKTYNPQKYMRPNSNEIKSADENKKPENIFTKLPNETKEHIRNNFGKPQNIPISKETELNKNSFFPSENQHSKAQKTVEISAELKKPEPREQAQPNLLNNTNINNQTIQQSFDITMSHQDILTKQLRRAT